jgi:hypothetical protein
MLTNTKATFEDIHAAFTSQLTVSRAADVTFFENVDRQTRILSAPLAEEYVEAFFTRDGKRVSETFTIGDRIEKFRRLVEKEEMQLGDYWKQWDEVQKEYVELGGEVFGEKGFGEDGKGVKKVKDGERGWKREMELLEVEYETRIQELDEEVGGIREEFLKVMKTSEKVGCYYSWYSVMMLTFRFRNWISSGRKSRLDFFKLLSRSDGTYVVYWGGTYILLGTWLGVMTPRCVHGLMGAILKRRKMSYTLAFTWLIHR